MNKVFEDYPDYDKRAVDIVVGVYNEHKIKDTIWVSKNETLLDAIQNLIEEIKEEKEKVKE